MKPKTHSEMRAPNPSNGPPRAARTGGGLRRSAAGFGRLGRGGFLLLVGALLVGGFAMRARLLEANPAATGAERPLPVEVARVEMLDAFESFDRMAGRVVSRRQSDLGFERSGTIARVLVDAGDRVKKGDLLAELDLRELSAAKREAAARVAATRSRLELAQVTAARQKKLRDSEYVSPQAFDEAEAAASSLGADLAASRAAYQRTKVAIELSQLIAPYDAIVVSRNLDEGSVASPAQTVLSIVEAGVQEVQIGVPPELASELEIGRAYEIENRSGELDENGQPYIRQARLVRLVPQLDPQTRTQTAILEIEHDANDAHAPRLADGSLAHVRIARSVPAQGAWLPISALAEGRRGTWTTYAVVPAEDAAPGDPLVVERRLVEVIQTEGLRAFVRGTIASGDRIVVDGLHRLIPGVAVSVENPLAMPVSPEPSES